MTVRTGLAVARDASNNGTTPQGFRLALGGLLASNGASGVDVRTGVLWDTGGAVVTGTGVMTYSIRSCVAVVLPSATQGPVLVPNDSAITVATTAAPGSNARIDVIWVRQHLLATDGGADTDVIGEWGVTQGVAGASPAAPAIPTGAVEVARATVTAGTTATNTLTISQTHRWTVAKGAPIPVRDDTERGALSAFSGMLVNHLGSKVIQQYDGTTWKALGSGGSSMRLMAPTANQLIASGTETKLNLWANRPENADAGALVTVAGGDFTVAKSGFYQIVLRTMWTSNSGSYRDLYLYVNGSKFDTSHGNPSGGGTGQAEMRTTTYLTAGNTFYFNVKQNSGSSLNVFGKVQPAAGFEDSSRLDISYLGP